MIGVAERGLTSARTLSSSAFMIQAPLNASTDNGASCPLCGGGSKGDRFPYVVRWNGKRFDYLGCDGCGATFVHPMPDSSDFSLMYRQETYHDLHYATEEVTAEAGVLQEVSSYLKPSGVLLDYGCGNGDFLKEAARAGYDSRGVELDPSAIANAAAMSGRPVTSYEELSATNARFDIIRLGDVLEHLPEPASTLRTLDGLLASGGVYLIEGPLEDNPGPVLFASRLFGRIKKRLNPSAAGSYPPYHLTRVSAEQQRGFFERAGYRVRLFATREDGWPYRSPGSSPQGIVSRLRLAIAWSGIAFAAAGAAFGLKLGNRFIAVLEPER